VKLGLGLYRHQLNAEHYCFAKQCGCTHLVIHLVDYFRSSRSNQPGDQPCGGPNDTKGASTVTGLADALAHLSGTTGGAAIVLDVGP